MSGPQDIGGRRGLGSLEIESDEPVFHAQWERRVFGLSFCSWLASGVAVDESRQAQAEMPYARYYGSTYYERWLHALELLMIERGVMVAKDGRGGGHPAEPAAALIEPTALREAALFMIDHGVKRWREAPAGPVFTVGDAVRARRVNPPYYARLPSYLKGCEGAVEEHSGSFSHPEDLARGELERPGAHCYRVRFGAAELWGPDAESPEDSVCVDLFENYLEAA